MESILKEGDCHLYTHAGACLEVKNILMVECKNQTNIVKPHAPLQEDKTSFEFRGYQLNESFVCIVTKTFKAKLPCLFLKIDVWENLLHAEARFFYL